MKAASSPRITGGPTRLQQALKGALRMRLALGDLRSGVATMTDRVLPDLFPTANEQVFTATLDDAVGINRPPPKGFSTRATTFAALDTSAGRTSSTPGRPTASWSCLVDGETASYFPDELRGALRGPPHTDFVIVRFWH